MTACLSGQDCLSLVQNYSGSYFSRKSGLTGFYLFWLLENISDYSGQDVKLNDKASQKSDVQHTNGFGFAA